MAIALKITERRHIYCGRLSEKRINFNNQGKYLPFGLLPIRAEQQRKRLADFGILSGKRAAVLLNCLTGSF